MASYTLQKRFFIKHLFSVILDVANVNTVYGCNRLSISLILLCCM